MVYLPPCMFHMCQCRGAYRAWRGHDKCIHAKIVTCFIPQMMTTTVVFCMVVLCCTVLMMISASCLVICFVILTSSIWCPCPYLLQPFMLLWFGSELERFCILVLPHLPNYFWLCLPESLPGVVAKKDGFIFVFMMLTLDKCLCFVLIGAFWVTYIKFEVFCVVGFHYLFVFDSQFAHSLNGFKT